MKRELRCLDMVTELLGPDLQGQNQDSATAPLTWPAGIMQ